MSNFPFISDSILRINLDLSFEHIIDLLSLSESETYKDEEVLVSSLRKTIIIHTASIIEALLLWRLKKECKVKKIELVDEWKYFDIRVIHTLNSSEEVVAGKRKKKVKEMNKLDFVRITDLCHHHKIIENDILRDDIDKIRLFRNRLHIGGLAEIEKKYSKKDLEFSFGVARKVKSLIQR